MLSQEDVWVSHIKIGDVQVDQGSLNSALEGCRAGIVVVWRLATAEPDNARWQRDLSASYDRVGNVLVAQGDLEGPLKAYRAALAIDERLVAAAPDDPGSLQYLSVSHDNPPEPGGGGSRKRPMARRSFGQSRKKIGDVLVAEDALNGALGAYRADLLIAQQLATADLDNAEWQRDLSISLARVADTLLCRDNIADALPLAQQALAQRRAAIDRFPNDPRLPQGLVYYENLVRRAGGTP